MLREQTESLLHVDDLAVHFQGDGEEVRAVSGVSLELHRGETLGLVGESGSGKSLTSLAIMGLLPTPPARLPRGRIVFDGQEILGRYGAGPPRFDKRVLRDVRGKRMAMIFQDPMSSLNPYLRIQRQLTEVVEVHQGVSPTQARHRALEMLERVGIPEPGRRLRAYPHELSGGMRQRVMIAMALMCQPDLLIADEPTTALDVTVQAQILDLMRELTAEQGVALLLITHDLGVVAGMADRVAVMYAGRIVEEGPCGSLFAAPQHPYTRGLLRSVPRMDAERTEPLSTIAGLPPDPRALPPGCPFEPRCDLAGPRCASGLPDISQVHGAGQARCFALTEGGTG